MTFLGNFTLAAPKIHPLREVEERGPLAGCVHVLPHGVGYGRLEGGKVAGTSNKCTMTYHDEEKNMFRRHPHFSTSTKKTLELKK